MKKSEIILTRVFNEAEIELTSEQLEMFIKYTDIMLLWNEKMNLTAITDLENIAVKHFADSLTLLKYFNGVVGKGKDYRLIDIGTGAGFPGVPLKIMMPLLPVTLMDSLQKRIRFLCEIIETLNLTYTEAVHMRAEDGANMVQYREQFDIAVSRAVAGLDILSLYALAYVKPGGRFIAMKGPEPEEEIKTANECIKSMGGEINSVSTVILPLSDIKHSIILIDKVRPIENGYPQKLLKSLKKSKK